MEARCPNNPEHKQFVTVAHVMEDWLVDEHGNWVETLGSGETSFKPDPGNIWTCHVCGAQAEVT